jgi:hypothetical protein
MSQLCTRMLGEPGPYTFLTQSHPDYGDALHRTTANKNRQATTTLHGHVQCLQQELDTWPRGQREHNQRLVCL